MYEQQPIKQNILKTAFDKCLAGLFLIITSPLFIVIVLASLLDSLFFSEDRGPVFYKEKRISQGELFGFYKFRIFKQKALDKMMAERGIIITKELEYGQNNITRFGKVLQKVYLDELPQLWNVFTGDISFVGTRPWNPFEYEKEIAKGVYRKKIIKAGLVGAVQINKGKFNGIEEEWALDYDYIEKCKTLSPFRLLLLDISIIAKSILVMLKAKGL
ncbi:sugar transferase [Candidatus Margulisiibacteriota bacterium]